MMFSWSIHSSSLIIRLVSARGTSCPARRPSSQKVHLTCNRRKWSASTSTSKATGQNTRSMPSIFTVRLQNWTRKKMLRGKFQETAMVQKKWWWCPKTLPNPIKALRIREKTTWLSFPRREIASQIVSIRQRWKLRPRKLRNVNNFRIH